MTTKSDILIKKLKNNKYISLFILAGIIVISLGKVFGAFEKVYLGVETVLAPDKHMRVDISSLDIRRAERKDYPLSRHCKTAARSIDKKIKFRYTMMV